MRRIILVLLFGVLGFIAIGCNGGLNSTTNSQLVTTNLNQVIESEYHKLTEQIPLEISESIYLPNGQLDGFVVEYYLDDVLLRDNFLFYTPQYYDEDLDLIMIISYQGLKRNFSLTITQLRDEQLFDEEMTNQKFKDIFNEIRGLFPEVIVSDFTLPKIDISGVDVSFTTDKSYILFDRFIFTFPEFDEEVNITISVSFNRETRNLIVPIIMSGFVSLPRIPEIHIQTDLLEEITTKEYYISGSLDLISFDQFQNSSYQIQDARMRIKLRGNSTLHMPKKPYKIKFDSKQYMLSEYKEKDWVLLANFADQTLIRNALAYQMSHDLQMDFSPMVRFVDVYINGFYQGNYFLTDQIEVSSNRVNIEEKSTDIDTGYLIEYDMRIYDEGLDTTEENYFLVGGVPFVIKSPDIEDEHYSHEQYQFIENYIQNLYETLVNQLDYTHLIDEASFVDWFIVNEVFKNVDSGFSSIYFNKDKEGLLKMGPIWDFDLSAGNPGHLQADLRVPEGFYTSRPDKNIFFYYLMKYQSFQEALKERWNEVFDDIIIKILDNIYLFVDEIARSRHLNFQKWDVIGINDEWYTAPEILELKTYEEQVWFLFNYLEIRISWLNQEVNYL